MCVTATANQLPFSEAAFSGLSDIHECLGGLMILCIDLATFYDILSTVGPFLGLFEGANS